MSSLVIQDEEIDKEKIKKFKTKNQNNNLFINEQSDNQTGASNAL